MKQRVPDKSNKYKRKNRRASRLSFVLIGVRQAKVVHMLIRVERTATP